MAGESLLQQAFAGAGEQLDRIIDAYERKKDTKQYFRVRNTDGINPLFSIKTPWPIADLNPVVGYYGDTQINGVLYSGWGYPAVVSDPNDSSTYIGEFIGTDPDDPDAPPVVWFQRGDQGARIGIREIIEE